MKEQWQKVSWMVQQRKKDIDELMRQWQLFRSSLLSLSRFLANTNSFITAVKNQDCHSLCQLRNLIKDFKVLYLLLTNLKTVFFYCLRKVFPLLIFSVLVFHAIMHFLGLYVARNLTVAKGNLKSFTNTLLNAAYMAEIYCVPHT